MISETAIASRCRYGSDSMMANVSTLIRRLAIVLLSLSLIAAWSFAQEDETFEAELDGRKTWTIQYGFGDALGLAGIGLAAGTLTLDQTLKVDLRAEALSILTVEGHFDDQQAESLQSLTVRLDTERLDGILGDFTVESLAGFSTHRRKMLGARLEYLLGGATLTAVASRFEGITESMTFVGQTAAGEVIFSAFLPDRPWVTQPYARGIDGLYAYPLTSLYVEEISAVALTLPGSAAVRSVLTAHGLEYLVGILGESPGTELDTTTFVVVGDAEQTLLLNVVPCELIRRRLEDAIDTFNEENDLTGSDRRTYPFVLGSAYETNFLEAVAAHARIGVDTEEHSILDAVRNRFYDLGQTGVPADSVVVEVSSDGTTYTPITRADFADYEAFVHSDAGILEIDFPGEFFDADGASMRVRFSYTVSSGAYLLGFSLVPDSERVSVNGVSLTRSDYEIDYEIGLLILLIDVEEADVVHVEYERFSGGLGGASDYARYFLGLTLDLPLSDAFQLTATVQQGVDDPDSVSNPSQIRTMPNRQTVGGVVGSIALDDLSADFSLGYGADVFPFGGNERPPLPNEVTVILEGGGYLFVGHRNGFSVLRDGAWRGYGVSEGLSGRDVRAIAVDEDRVYLGTNAGLTVVALTGTAPFDRVRSWSRYGEYDGLADPSVRAVLVHDERLWICTDDAVVSVAPEALDDPSAWEVVDLPALPLLTALVEGTDALYIGTEAGVYRFDPASADVNLLAGSAGLHVNALTIIDETLYVSSDRGLRAFRSGVGTGWITYGTEVFAVAALGDELYYGTDDGMVRASDEARFHQGWSITAIADDASGFLWAGSQADVEYTLKVWRRGETVDVFDNSETRIDGRDTSGFGELPANEHTATGALALASFYHESDRFALTGHVSTTAPGYHSIGSVGSDGTTEWQLSATATPWDGVDVSANHEYFLRDRVAAPPRTRAGNRVAVTGTFGPRVSISLDQESINDIASFAGPETVRVSFGFSIDDSLFDDAVRLSVSWIDTANSDLLESRVRRDNRLAARGALELAEGLSFSASWARPLGSIDGTWSGSENWTLGGDWSREFDLGRVSCDASLQRSRSLPEGDYGTTTAASADIDLVSFDLTGWRITPGADVECARKNESTEIKGRAVVRGSRGGIVLRTTVTGEASGLGEPVRRTNSTAVVTLSYSGSETWRPSLTYTAKRAVTTQEGVGSASSVEHSVTGRSNWIMDDATDDLSFSVRMRDAGGVAEVTGSVDNSYRLDLTERLLRPGADGEMSEDEPFEPFPAAFLLFDATGDCLWEQNEADFDFTLSARLDVALSQLWGGSLSMSYMTGTKSSGDLYHSFALSLTVSVDF